MLEDWRVSCKDSPSKYRPISLTSVVGKVLEIIIRGNINKRFEFIQDSQHEFIKDRSCLAKLIQFFDEGNAVDVTDMGFKKEFDKVSHGRLV